LDSLLVSYLFSASSSSFPFSRAPITPSLLRSSWVSLHPSNILESISPFHYRHFFRFFLPLNPSQVLSPPLQRPHGLGRLISFYITLSGFPIRSNRSPFSEKRAFSLIALAHFFSSQVYISPISFSPQPTIPPRFFPFHRCLEANFFFPVFYLSPVTFYCESFLLYKSPPPSFPRTLVRVKSFQIAASFPASPFRFRYSFHSSCVLILAVRDLLLLQTDMFQLPRVEAGTSVLFLGPSIHQVPPPP